MKKTVYIAPETYVEPTVMDDGIMEFGSMGISDEERDEGYAREEWRAWNEFE